jgi:hypothetical protein
MAQSPDRKSGASDAGKGSGKKPPKATSGVRGPGGPPPPPSARGAQSGRPAMGARSGAPSDLRKKFEDFSYPLLTRMSAIPRWLVVVVPAVLLLLGLIRPGPCRGSAALLLLVGAARLAHQLCRGWPSPRVRASCASSMLIALLGIVGLKFAGRL